MNIFCFTITKKQGNDTFYWANIQQLKPYLWYYQTTGTDIPTAVKLANFKLVNFDGGVM